jgi:hypothetical protein
MTSDAPALNMNPDELAFWKAVFLGELRLRTDDC